ncbi:MAG: diguanylate cyclase [Ruthenibacterium sp.]
MKCKRVIVRIVCSLLISVLFVGAIWDFLIQTQRTLTKETYRTLAAVSEDYNKAFLDRISYHVKTMNVLAGVLEEMDTCSKDEAIRILQNAVDGGGFDKMVVCDAKGYSCANDGVLADVSHRDYYKTAIKGEMCISEPLASVSDGAESIVIAVPIQRKGVIVGVLFGVYPISAVGSQLFDFTYYSEGYGFVTTPDGTIVLSNEHKDKLLDGQNLFTFFEKVNFSEYSLAQLQSAVAKGEKGNFEFEYAGKRRFVSFMPSTVKDWYMFSVSSDEMLLQQEKTTNRIMMQLVFTLAVMCLFLFLWIRSENKRRNKQILQANEKYESLLTHINGGVIVANHAENIDETIISYVSNGFTDMTGYTLSDIQTLYHGRYLEAVIDEDRQKAFDIYLTQIATGNTYHMPYRIRKKSGGIVWVMDNGYLVQDPDGMQNHSILTDITVIKQQEEELRLSENRFSLAINASSGTLFEVDTQSQLYTHFENAERIFGVSAETLLADTRAFAALPHDEYSNAVTHYFFHPDDFAAVEQALAQTRVEGTSSFEARLRRGDGSYIWARIDLKLVPDAAGKPKLLIGFMSDIDTIKKQAERLENKVQTDPMTGLYNKIAMATLANKTLQEYPNGHHALLVMDIDNFKGINDTLGHAFGDLVLMEVCTKLKTSFRNVDIVGRMGGDEFAVMMQNVPDSSSVLKKATELSELFRRTYAGEKGNYKISCSIGIIMIEGRKEPFETLYRKADAALYQAKRNGKDQFVLYREKDAAHYPIAFTRTNDEELENLKGSQSMESQIFELLYTAKDFGISINMALAAIGQHYHVSRVSIFENDAENCTTDNTYEWCNHDVPAAMGKMQNISLTENGENILDSFDADGMLYCNDTSELPHYLKKVLHEKGALSTLQIMIINDKKLCGFIGFDACDEHRIWTSGEIAKLSFLAKVLSVFLFKKKAEVSLMENLQIRLKILDVLPDYICVVNPETHALVYANSKMQALIPAAKPGAFCFQTLRGGQTSPCATCIVERIRRGDTNHLEIVSEDQSLRLKINAFSINWTNDTKMVLLYSTEKDAQKLTPPAAE